MKQPLRNKIRLPERRASALARKAASDLLTPQQRLEKLDRAFGPGVGAVRERARLAEQIKNPKKKVEAAAPVQETKTDIVESKKDRPRKGSKPNKKPVMDPVTLVALDSLEEANRS